MREKAAKKEKWYPSLWLKYAATYLLVLAVPFLAFTLFFNSFLAQETEKNARETLESALDKIVTDFDQRVEQMAVIGAQLDNMRDFGLVSLQNFDYSVRYGVQRSLLAFKNTNTFFRDILYYHRAQPQVVFSGVGTYLTSYYRLVYDSVSGRFRPLNGLSAVLVKGWVPCQRVTAGQLNLPAALLYIQPLTTVSGGYLIFEIQESSVRAMTRVAPPQSELYILAGNTLLYPFQGEAPVMPLNEPGKRPDGRYQYARFSPSTGLTYLYIAEISNIGAMARTMLTSFMALSAAVSALCFGAIVIFSRRHAKPIEQLVTLADDIAPGGGPGVVRLQNAMHQLQSRIKELDEMRQNTMRGHALIRLIRGKYRGEEEAEDNLRRLDIAFRQPYRVILLMEAAGEDREELTGRALEYLARQHDVYGFAYAERSAYVMMVGMDSESRAPLERELRAFIAQLGPAESRPRFSLGGEFTHFTRAQESYMQALSAARRDPAKAVALYQAADENELFYPREELRALGAALENQDRNRTAFLYDVLMKLVRQHTPEYFYTVSLVSEMINLYLQAPSRQNPEGGEENYAASLQGMYMNDPEDMIACLQRLHTQALQWMTENDLSSSTTEMTGVANYISACEELDTLTVGTVAERFGLNISSLSHKFKEQMGCNISDYILTCKMNHACTLLRSTEETVADIAEKVGYSQYTSFVRQFKRQKGVTPTAYREAWQRGEGKE